MKEELAERIKIGDKQAFELLFYKYYVSLCGFANKFLHNPEEAKDVVQEVFTNIWEKREDIDSEESIMAYIFKITQNKSLNSLRKKKVVSRHVEILRLVYIDYTLSPSHESLLAKELENDISAAIQKVPLKCRKVFELSRLKGLKYQEISKVLNISVKTVEVQISKALQILRLELKDYL
jgi:RNA polymerase sigma-70 factor (ECF subfamily)